MKICKTAAELNECLLDLGGELGFVPTMGALHEGHLSLVSRSKTENDFTCCSIFVNPTQFNNKDDFEKYPSTLTRDIELLESVDCDILFYPNVQEMYVKNQLLNFGFGSLENVMEGEFRPGHFSGVATIVSKLFHMVMPQKAYFGQKDLQQFLVIQELVDALSFPLELCLCDIAREPHGLAMSSRNERLSSEDRTEAAIIFKSLLKVTDCLKNNYTVNKAIEEGKKLLSKSKNFRLEYLMIVDRNTLQSFEDDISNPEHTAICIAGYFDEVRLIDNHLFN